jgi:formylglycine-generating enzyme required for sulfatase activity
VALPNPIPDNPLRWDAWKNYNSDDYYARLCLSFEANPSAEQIEENCRQLLVWWQKKLPLKNQPSNPLAQILRAGLDEAPAYLAEARTRLLDPVARAAFDDELQKKIVADGLAEFKKLLAFAVGDKKLREEDEARLFERGRQWGLSQASMQEAIEAELAKLGAARVTALSEAPPPQAQGAASSEPKDPFDEFRRMLRLAKSLDGEDMTDERRDMLCDVGQNLGLTGGEAEDLIDEYLDELSGMPIAPPPPRTAATAAAKAKAPAPAPVRPPTSVRPTAAPVKKSETGPIKPAVPKEPTIQPSPVSRAHERQMYPNFTNVLGMEMRLVTSGSFQMGSADPEAAPQEQPVTPVSISCFFMARFPVTNAQYEIFDPSHRNKRAPWANENHPVVYLNSRDAEKFCAWLSSKQGKKFRLPTEAEWEYAARGLDNRIFPWGEKLDAGNYANFADKRTSFAWRDTVIDDGFAETAPVGTYPRGASPFGIEDMAGNVFEWCLDCFETYKGKERVNPRGVAAAHKRIYRGGSWKSRAGNLRASARNFNLPDYSSNDVGFRVVCECEA